MWILIKLFPVLFRRIGFRSEAMTGKVKVLEEKCDWSKLGKNRFLRKKKVFFSLKWRSIAKDLISIQSNILECFEHGAKKNREIWIFNRNFEKLSFLLPFVMWYMYMYVLQKYIFFYFSMWLVKIHISYETIYRHTYACIYVTLFIIQPLNRVITLMTNDKQIQSIYIHAPGACTIKLYGSILTGVFWLARVWKFETILDIVKEATHSVQKWLATMMFFRRTLLRWT